MPASPDATRRSRAVAIPHGAIRAGALIHELRLRPVGGDDNAFLLDTAGSLAPGDRANGLLARCLDEDDAATLVSSLVVGDREALLLQLRRLTLGETLDSVITCAADGCGERMELELRVGELLLATYPEVRATYDLVVDAAKPPLVVEFRPPTVADLAEAELVAGGDADAVASELLERCIVAARRGRNPVPVERLGIDARELIAAAMAERDPQAEIELDLTCPSCETSFVVVFDTATYLLQELDARAVRLLEEVHALALHYHWSEREILALAPTRRERYLALLADSLSGAETAAHAAT